MPLLEFGEEYSLPLPLDLEDETERAELMAMWDAMLAKKLANERHVRVLKMRTGLLDGKIYSFREIAQELKVTTSRIRQIYDITLTRMWSVFSSE